MKNTAKDRFDKKLIRFIRELDKGWDKYRTQANGFAAYLELKEKLFKKYGFTEEEWNKASRLIRSWTADENGIKKTKRHERKKKLREEKNLDFAEFDNGRQEHCDEAGEEQIRLEDRWLGDVSDESLAYCDFLDMEEDKKC